MSRRGRNAGIAWMILALLSAVLVLTARSIQMRSGFFHITRTVIGGGGQKSTGETGLGADLSLTATIGQPDAVVWTNAPPANLFFPQLRGGFWPNEGIILAAPFLSVNRFQFTMETEPGVDYVVERNDDLRDIGGWSDFRSFTGTGMATNVVIELPGETRFNFRVREE